MRYLKRLSIHPFYNDEQTTADSGVKPVSSDIEGNSMVEEGFLTSLISRNLFAPQTTMQAQYNRTYINKNNDYLTVYSLIKSNY